MFTIHFFRVSALTLALGSLVALTACGSTTPALDARFGEAVRTAQDQQTLNPGPASKDAVLGIDGKAAAQAQERYQESFKTPPRTFEVLGIGGSQQSQ